MKRRIDAILAAAALVTGVITVHGQFAQANTISSVILNGGAGTVVVGSTLFAKPGGTLTLEVKTDSATRCVEVTGLATSLRQTSAGTSTWNFLSSAASGSDGPRTVTAKASNNFNSANCTGSSNSVTAGYTVDNTGPTVTATKIPSVSWANTNVSVSWNASDGTGSGVATGPAPAGATVTAEGATDLSSTATDRLGNVGSGADTVRIDKTLPTISGSRTPVANTNGWNNSNVTVSFNCSDPSNSSNATPGSGITSCVGGNTLNQNGITASVPGTATDNGGNNATASVGPIRIDKAAPNAPTVSVNPAANAAGWNSGPVSISFAANGDSPANSASGVAGCSAFMTLTGETSAAGVTQAGTCTDLAGNQSSPVTSRNVKIDLTAPNTTHNAPGGWNNNSVAINLGATDNLSGVASTNYILDNGAPTSGSALTISAEGTHTLEYWSVDVAGNTEAHKTLTVKIDKTSPTITHSLSPAPNSGGWNKSDTTVTFDCADALSGIASCTTPQTVSTNGKNQTVPGLARDNAGNSANDSANVDLDKALPTITGAPDRAANGNGWYDAAVTVSFTCTDQAGLSGVVSCTAPVTLGEGETVGVPGSVTDAAGNSASTSVGPIRIDTTRPIVTGLVSGPLSPSGWYTGDVTIVWSCSDALSGLDGDCPAPTVLTGEGGAITAGVSVHDLAGNQGDGLVTGLKIDRHAPNTTASLPPFDADPWFKDGVTVNVSATDPLSGVAHTFAAIDGGTPTEVVGGLLAVTGNGTHTVGFWSVDAAGNEETHQSLRVKVDAAAPSITGSRNPAANGFGWNNQSVDVTFLCGDGESGIAACTGDTTLSNEGADQMVNGLATDSVGHTTPGSVSGISIDLTKPTVIGSATTAANAAGWFRNDVTIRWTPFDALSGIDPATVPADSVVTGEGGSLMAGPATVTDKAGNVSNSAFVGSIRIDRTAPGITAATQRLDNTAWTANADGWFNSSVRVHYSCSDALSGVAACDDDDVLSSDGASQSASGTAFDVAGNSTSVTKYGINIDSQSPATVGTIDCTGKNGWCRNTAAVTLDATDQAGLSGVKDVYYRFGTSGNFIRKADPVTFNIALNSAGKAVVQFYAVDKAGNQEPLQTSNIKYDTIAPTITMTRTPGANASLWNRTDLSVDVSAVDTPDAVTNDLGSGVETLTVDNAIVGTHTTESDPTPLTYSKSFTAETAGTAVNASAEDFAGNTGSDSLTVKLDKTAPTISGASTTLANANGWYNGPVAVRWTCADTLSGVAVCPADDLLTTNAANQSVSATAKDSADNTASSNVSGINIDAVKPSVQIIGLLGSPFIVGPQTVVTCAASDALSGLDGPCTVLVTTSGNGVVGTFDVTATAKDKAGNSAAVTGSYRVVYGFGGFLQPVNDTGRPSLTCGSPCVASVFKGGSTVPLKFQLRNASGTPIQSPTLPEWVTPKQGSATTLAVDEVAYTDPASSGQAFKWDPTAQQYIFTWGTKNVKVGYFWKIGVKLDDGNSYVIDVALR